MTMIWREVLRVMGFAALCPSYEGSGALVGTAAVEEGQALEEVDVLFVF